MLFRIGKCLFLFDYTNEISSYVGRGQHLILMLITGSRWIFFIFIKHSITELAQNSFFNDLSFFYKFNIIHQLILPSKTEAYLKP